MALEQEQRKRLYDALLDAFRNHEDLRRMVGLHLGEGLDKIAASVANLKDATFELIQWAEAQGCVPRLVQGALADAPGNAELNRFVRDYPQFAPTAAESAIMELTALMASEPIRGIVAAFRAQFEAARQQIAALRAYKEVHDRLHDLQVFAYDPIVREGTDDPNLRANLREHADRLAEYVDGLKVAVADTALAGMDSTWVGVLEAAVQDMEAFLAAPAGGGDRGGNGRLESAKARLRRVVARQPSNIDVRLNERARTLKLQGLVRSLAEIGQQLSDRRLSEGDTKRVERFGEAIKGVATLEQDLESLVRDHREWQETADLLRLVESELPREAELNTGEGLDRLEGLKDMWPEVRARVQPLQRNPSERWVRALVEAGREVDLAMEANNPPRVRESVLRFRNRARDRFYFVDKTLKQFCERLATLKEPLDELLARI